MWVALPWAARCSGVVASAIVCVPPASSATCSSASSGSGPSLATCDVDAVEALVDEPHRARRQRAAQVGERHLRRAARGRAAPSRRRARGRAPTARSRPPQRRGRAAPLAEDDGHHLAADLAAEGEVALAVGGAQRGRIVQPVQLGQVVVADVGEVPVGADVARHALAVGDRAVGQVGERQALRGEADARRAHVAQRPPVAADAEVVGDARPGMERHRAAARRRRHVGHVGAGRPRQLRQQHAEQLAATQRRIHPEHRRLLLDLAVAAQHRQARPPGDLREQRPRLVLDRRPEARRPRSGSRGWRS